MPGWRNWQTHHLEGVASERLYEFESRSGHKTQYHSMQVLLPVHLNYTLKLLAGMLLIFAFSCTSPAHKKAADSTQVATVLTPPLVDTHTWMYTQDTDKMSPAKDYFAAITAVKQLQFKAAADSAADAILTIRHLSGKNRLTLTVTKGRFLNTDANGEHVRIKFDNGSPSRYACDPGLDGSQDMLYIHPANNLISRLKKSKRLIIEANFLNNGLQQMTFNVQGLKWDHKSVYLGDN